MRRAAGFSLIEMVVVIVIVAVLAALAIPRLSDSESKATWYHEEVKAAVRYAQRQAVAQHRTVYVSLGTNYVELCYASDCSVKVQPAAGGLEFRREAPSGVTISAAGTTFHFNALGQPSAAQAFTVGGRAVTVTAETGYVP